MSYDLRYQDLYFSMTRKQQRAINKLSGSHMWFLDLTMNDFKRITKSKEKIELFRDIKYPALKAV